MKERNTENIKQEDLHNFLKDNFFGLFALQVEKMMKKILLLTLLFTGYLMAELINLTPEDVEDYIEDGVVVIDIRTAPEWKETGVIKGSKLITFFDLYGRYDIDKFMKEFEKYVPTKDSKFILVCRTGSRTKMVGDFLSSQLGYTNAMHLSGGVYAWIREKRPLVEPSLK